MGWSELRICEIGGKGGLFLPVSEREADIPLGARAVIYLFFMVYCFLGVSIAADIFMSSIEAITSRRAQKLRRNGKIITYKVWNETVANLSLMALGSSAPEIFLSIIDLVRNDFHAGELGPSTIVGSAAFNLFVIVAVCMLAIPSGDGRCVEQVPVFIVTAIFSLLAYVWLVVIVSFWTPDVVTILEAVLTFAFLPLLIYLSWRVDVGGMAGLLPCCVSQRKEETRPATLDGGSGSDLNVSAPQGRGRQSMRMSIANGEKHDSKHDLMKMITAGKGVARTFSCRSGLSVYSAGGNPSEKSRENRVAKTSSRVQFLSDFQMMSRNRDAKPIWLCRYGDLTQEVRVEYSLFQLTAPAATPMLVRTLPDLMQQWVPVLPRGQQVPQFDPDGSLKGRPKNLVKSFEATFVSGEDQKEILVPKPENSGCKDFIVQLTHAQALNDSSEWHIGPLTHSSVKISPHESRGKVKFACEKISVPAGTENPVSFEVVVLRVEGCSGDLSCNYVTEPLSALPDTHYAPSDGVIEFADGVTEARLELQVLPLRSNRHPKEFVVILDDPNGDPPADFDANNDGGADAAILTVQISTPPGSAFWRRLDWLVNLDSIRLGNADWFDSATGVVFVGGSLEEQREASCIDWVFHVIALPWKIFFVFVPPVHYLGGWVCFVASLLYIALLTGVIADLADLFGCVCNLPDMVTAITFVALGTSMPDLFASKGAAQEDPTADASIVNVTGSNSVNVFLGLGLPWTMASIFWEFQERTPNWEARYGSVAQRLPGIAFVVEGRDLGFNVFAFSCCCVVGLVMLSLRRRVTGYELGGPAGVKYSVAFLFVCLWFAYIGLASWRAMRPLASKSEELEVILSVSAVLLCILLMALGFLLREHVRNLAAPPKEEEPIEDVEVASSERDKNSPRIDFTTLSESTQADDRPGEEGSVDIKPPLVAVEAPSGSRGRCFAKS